MFWQYAGAFFPAGSQTLIQNAGPPMKLQEDERRTWYTGGQDSLGPVDDLLVRVVVPVASGESVRAHEATQRVATL